MNLTPPWSLRDVASETLFDMIFLKCCWRALLHLFCVVSWWRYHHDSCRSYSWCALFSWRKTSDFFTACVSLCGFLINTSHCDVSRTLVSIPPGSSRHPLTNDNWHDGSHLRVSSVIEPVIVFVLRTAIFALCVHVMNTKPPRSERLSLTSDGWHGGCHPRVFLWRSQSSSLC